MLYRTTFGVTPDSGPRDYPVVFNDRTTRTVQVERTGPANTRITHMRVNDIVYYITKVTEEEVEGGRMQTVLRGHPDQLYTVKVLSRDFANVVSLSRHETRPTNPVSMTTLEKNPVSMTTLERLRAADGVYVPPEDPDPPPPPRPRPRRPPPPSLLNDESVYAWLQKKYSDNIPQNIYNSFERESLKDESNWPLWIEHLTSSTAQP